MNPHYGKWHKYVMSAIALADSLKADIARNCEVSHDTIRALSKFISAQNEINAALDLLQTLSDDPSSKPPLQ